MSRQKFDMQIMRQKQIINSIIDAGQEKEEILTDTDNKTHAPITTDVLLTPFQFGLVYAS